MIAPTLPLPEEPRALKSMARTLLDQAPETGLPLVVAGEWIADPLWESWGDVLEERGMDRERFGQIVAGYGNELRLWVAGERPWQHSISGLAGRVERRLAPVTSGPSGSEPRRPWQDALGRIGVAPDDAMATLIARIGELHLLYDIAPPNGKEGSARSTSAASAIVWAGGRPRDPEVPFGEGHSGSSSAALAEALGRFLLKDPAYPPRFTTG
jgi:hypothetical protein